MRWGYHCINLFNKGVSHATRCVRALILWHRSAELYMSIRFVGCSDVLSLGCAYWHWHCVTVYLHKWAHPRRRAVYYARCRASLRFGGTRAKSTSCCGSSSLSTPRRTPAPAESRQAKDQHIPPAYLNAAAHYPRPPNGAAGFSAQALIYLNPMSAGAARSPWVYVR